MTPVQRLAALGALAALSCGPGDRTDDAAVRGAGRPPPPITAAALAAQLAVPAESLRAAGEELYWRQAYDSARLVFEVERERAHTAADGAAEARARMWTGLAAYRLGDYDAARREGEASVALKRAHGLDAEISRSYNALGLLAWNEGRLHDAEVWFDSATAAARRHADGAGEARALGNMSLVLTQLGNYDGARRGFEGALAASRAVADDRVEGNTLTNLAMLETRMGNPRAALALAGAARAVYARVGWATGDQNALGQMATAWAALGDLQQAIAAANEELDVARRQGLRQEIASTLEVLADLHLQASDPRRALLLLAEADSLNRELGLEVERGNNQRRQAGILLELGETAVAAQRARAALAAHAGSGDRSEEVLDRLLLAELAARAGEASVAADELDAARTIARSLGPAARRLVALSAARVALGRGDARTALRALGTLPDAGDRADWQALDLRAAALLARGDLAGARVAGERAVAELERERGSLDLGPLRAGYLGGRIGPIARLTDIDLRLGDTAAAFAVAASVPGRGLAEHLLAAPDSDAGGLALVREGERLLHRLSDLERLRDSLGTGTDAAGGRDAVDRAIAGVRREYERYASETGRVPQAAVLGLTHPTLAATQAALAPDVLLLLPLVGPERTDLFAVRDAAVFHRALPLSATEVTERVRVARAALLGRPGSEPPEPLRALGRELLGPLAAAGLLDGARRLMVVAHGPLTVLPFAALWVPGDGGYLVERMAVVMLPSVGALAAGTTAPVADAALTLFAPLADSLPGTVREVRAIARGARGSEVRVGAAADEPAVRTALETGRIVHIASHGSLDAANPAFSQMRLHRSRTGAADDPAADGRLEAHEVTRLTVRSPLVFLSGCETGVGVGAASVLGGEEGSLAQAFLYAGAGSVVATLWPVGDREAADLAARFYALLAGSDPAEALALAQRAGIRQNQSFTWAAYVISGAPGAKVQATIR